MDDDHPMYRDPNLVDRYQEATERTLSDVRKEIASLRLDLIERGLYCSSMNLALSSANNVSNNFRSAPLVLRSPASDIARCSDY
jgi:hypothetical protein